MPPVRFGAQPAVVSARSPSPLGTRRSGRASSFADSSADDGTIAFTTRRDGDNEIYTVDVATMVETNLTNSPTSSEQLWDW